MDQVFVDIYNLVWKEIFPDFEIMPVDKFKRLYAADLRLPVAYKCSLNGSVVYSSEEYGYKRFISDEEVRKRHDQDNYMKPKVEFGSLGDVLSSLEDVALFKGGRAINSEVVAESDDIYSSSYIYNSTHIYGSQKVLFSYNNTQCEYLLASKGSKACTFSIRVNDSGSVANSFCVDWSGRSSNCYFCQNCADLRDCMFCFHIASKQFCIANMQFEEAEYRRLKAKILGDYFAQLDQPNAFVTLRDL